MGKITNQIIKIADGVRAILWLDDDETGKLTLIHLVTLPSQNGLSKLPPSNYTFCNEAVKEYSGAFILNDSSSNQYIMAIAYQLRNNNYYVRTAKISHDFSEVVFSDPIKFNLMLGV